VAFFQDPKNWYWVRLNRLMHRKLPPDEVREKTNLKRDLDPDGLTHYEETFHVSRQHWIVLVRPFAGLLTGLLLMLRPPGVLGFLIGAAFAWLVYTRVPLRQGRRERLIGAVLAVVLVVAAPRAGAVGLIVVIALLLWPIYDFADWWHEILVITNKRVINMHGIFTVNRPSIKMSSISFSNCISGPIGDFFHYGTIDLDTASQRDDALSNIEYVPHAYDVWRLILQLYSEHRRELGDQSPEEIQRRQAGMADPPPASDG
jgi:membrane protein YdbS with pleckstrin-like domain